MAFLIVVLCILSILIIWYSVSGLFTPRRPSYGNPLASESGHIVGLQPPNPNFHKTFHSLPGFVGAWYCPSTGGFALAPDVR